jgi:hypothetical protein
VVSCAWVFFFVYGLISLLLLLLLPLRLEIFSLRSLLNTYSSCCFFSEGGGCCVGCRFWNAMFQIHSASFSFTLYFYYLLKSGRTICVAVFLLGRLVLLFWRRCAKSGGWARACAAACVAPLQEFGQGSIPTVQQSSFKAISLQTAQNKVLFTFCSRCFASIFASSPLP